MEHRDRHSGFTLIEILVVVLIIGVLAAFVGPAVFQHLGTAKQTTARSQIELLGAALDAFRLDNGFYPTTSQGLASLVREPLTDPKPPRWNGPYLRKELPTDPWSRDYVYQSPATHSAWGYDLVTFGRDGAEGGEGEDADITSWN